MFAVTVWVTSSKCVFLSKVFVTKTENIHRSNTIVFYYTILLVSPGQSSHHQVDIGWTMELNFCVSNKKSNVA